MENQQLIPLPVITPETVGKLVDFLAKRRDVAVSELNQIVTIENDEQAAQVNDTLATAKQLYDAMSAKRKSFTDPIKKAIEEIMSYENEINYTAKSDNAYNRARAVLEEYNQKKVKEKQLQEYKAQVRADQLKYKAEFRAKVQEQLQDMLSGKHRTVLFGMSDWEKALTLENIDAKEQVIRNQQPTLKMDDYDKCFHRLGARPHLMTPEQEDEYLLELKTELPYTVYNEKFQQIVAPIKNEYLAKIPQIKERLQQQAKADAADKERLKKENEERIEKERKQSLAEAAKKDQEAKQSIADEKDLGTMNADFTAQAMVADVEAGPSKTMYVFENDSMWLQPFLQVVSKCAVHPKFKFKVKDAYVPEIDKFMKFYSQNIGEPMKGLKAEQVAKTIVKKSKD